MGDRMAPLLFHLLSLYHQITPIHKHTRATSHLSFLVSNIWWVVIQLFHRQCKRAAYSDEWGPLPSYYVMSLCAVCACALHISGLTHTHCRQIAMQRVVDIWWSPTKSGPQHSRSIMAGSCTCTTSLWKLGREIQKENWNIYYLNKAWEMIVKKPHDSCNLWNKRHTDKTYQSRIFAFECLGMQ